VSKWATRSVTQLASWVHETFDVGWLLKAKVCFDGEGDEPSVVRPGSLAHGGHFEQRPPPAPYVAN